MNTIWAFLESFFASKATQAVLAEVPAVVSTGTALIHALGVKESSHTASIVSNAASVVGALGSGPDAVAQVTTDTQALLTSAGVAPATVAEAGTIASVAISMAKAAGLVSAPAAQ